LNDHELLIAVGFPACPADAQGIIKKIPGIYVTANRGGHGAVRDFINHILGEEQMLSAWKQIAKNR
jgi:N-acylneuraminate cytidylyltransferase